MRFLVIAFILLTLAAVGFAQTAEKPVPMSEEPFHRRVLKNGSIEVFEVRLPVGAQMKFHEHPTDHFAVVIHPGQMRNETTSGRIITNPPIAPGSVVFLPAGDAHRQTNIDKSEVHFIAGEILREKPARSAPAPKTDGCRTLVFENDRMAAYRCILNPSRSTDSVRSTEPFLRIFISSGTIATRTNSKNTKPAGNVDWFNSGKRSAIRNVGDSDIELVEIELK